MKRTKYLVALLSGMSLTSGPAAWAVDEVTPPTPPTVTVDPVDEPETDLPDPVKDAARTSELATRFGVTETQVSGMRTTSKMGWGEIRNLLLIAQAVSLNSVGTATPLTMDQALLLTQAQRTSGMGLGQIANSYNLKLGALVSADRANAHADKAGKAERPDKPGKPEKLDKPDRPTKPDHPDKPDRPDKPDHPDKPDKPDRPGKGS